MKDILTAFNKLHQNIKFAAEFECNATLPFLDVSIHRRRDGSVQTRTYRKPTWTGQYLHFRSFVPLSYKRGLVRTLFNRARAICSDDTLEDELALLTEVLRENGYPSKFINKFSRINMHSEMIPTVPKKSVFIQLPFKGDNFPVYKRLKQIVSNVFRAADVKIIHRVNKIPQRSVKDKIPTGDTKNVIYQFKCECSSTYIGRTHRKLSTRIKELKSYTGC